MPDDKGNFVPGNMTVRGQGGELRYGFKTVTELGRWEANIRGTSEDGRTLKLQLVVRSHEADPFWIEHAPADEIELEMALGRRTLRGPATITAHEPKLVIEATVDTEA